MPLAKTSPDTTGLARISITRTPSRVTRAASSAGGSPSASISTPSSKRTSSGSGLQRRRFAVGEDLNRSGQASSDVASLTPAPAVAGGEDPNKLSGAQLHVADPAPAVRRPR